VCVLLCHSLGLFYSILVIFILLFPVFTLFTQYIYIQNVDGLSFDQMCAPVYYFNKYGVSILRQTDAVAVAQKLYQEMIQLGPDNVFI
jgi:hypothetical protein